MTLHRDYRRRLTPSKHRQTRLSLPISHIQTPSEAPAHIRQMMAVGNLLAHTAKHSFEKETTSRTRQRNCVFGQFRRPACVHRLGLSYYCMLSNFVYLVAQEISKKRDGIFCQTKTWLLDASVMYRRPSTRVKPMANAHAIRLTYGLIIRLGE